MSFSYLMIDTQSYHNVMCAVLFVIHSDPRKSEKSHSHLYLGELSSFQRASHVGVYCSNCNFRHNKILR